MRTAYPGGTQHTPTPPSDPSLGSRTARREVRPTGTASRRRRAGTVLLGLATVAAALLTMARFIPLPAPGPAVQALYPLAGAVAVGVCLIWLVLRNRRAVALSLPAALCAAWLSIGSVQSDTVPARYDDLTVMTQNMYYGKADATALMAQIRERRPDVLVIVESSSAAVARLRAAGLDEVLPYQAGDPDVEWEPAGGTVIRSRHPLTVLDRGTSSTFRQPVVQLRHAGRDVLVRGIHPVAPQLHDSSEWQADLEALGAWLADQSPVRPLVLAGDFNASRAHPSFRSATAGLLDAQDATGAGYVRTWPLGRRIPPFVQLDHVMTAGMAVVDAGTFTIPGTDHAGVWARLQFADQQT